MAAVTEQRTTFGYRPGLDGLRGIFVVAVLLFHGGVSRATGGFLGVSAFFTLSGFLICTLLLDEHASTGRVDLVAFWKRRARRLLPAAWITLLGAVAYGVAVGSPAVLRSLQADVVAALAYVANWRLITTGSSYEAMFSEPSPVTHLWSLAIEEQFYLVFPAAMALFLLAVGRRVWAIGVLLFALAAASAVWMAVLYVPGGETTRVYYGTDTRAAELLIGAGAAVVWRWWSRRPRAEGPAPWATMGLQALGATALLGLAWFWTWVPVSSAGLYRGGLVVHALAVVLVVVAAAGTGWFARLVAFGPLRRLGLISYGVYLYHWPLFLWLTPDRTGLDGPALLALRCTVTLCAATVSYAVVEQPVRHGRIVRGRTALVTAPAALALVVAAVAMVPAAPPSAFTVTSSSMEVGMIPDDLLDQLLPPEIPSQAEVAPPRVALFGDSSAFGVYHGLLHIHAGEGVTFAGGSVQMGCGLARTEMIRKGGIATEVEQRCAGWADSWPEAIEGRDIDIAIVLYGPWDVSDRRLAGDSEWRSVGDPVYDDFIRAEIRAAVDVLLADSDTVVWLTSPRLDQGRHLPVRTVVEAANDPVRVERWNAILVEEVAARDDDRMAVIDLVPWFDELPGGPFDPAYRPDGVHLLDEKGPELGDWLIDQLVAVWIERTEQTDRSGVAATEGMPTG